MMQQTISSRGAGRCATRLAGRRVSAPSLANRRARPSLVVRAQQVPEAEDEAEPTTSYSHAARQAYARLSAPPKVGAEYGEGFMQFRLGGEPRRLDVAALNESLKAGGALRLRFHNRPDEAYGCVFDFDSIIANTHGAYVSAWRQLAEARGLPLPRHARLSMHATAPERIIMDVLGWTNSMKEARALAFELAETYAQELAAGPAMATPLPGVREWLDALTAFNVPVAAVSVLDRGTVRRALERMHLHDHFQVLVTAEDELESTAQRYLSACLQLNRPPNMCAVFGGSPEAVTAAHNCTMKAVAVPVSPDYPAYKLRSADVTVARLDHLTVYNLRRLFANSGEEFMDLRTQRSDDKPANRRRVASALL